ncbi:MAG: hypothetical protein ABID61_01155 [Candidatus Micrarchaeota archaeon]
MDDTIPKSGELAGPRNKYAHLVEPGAFFRRLWNKVTNDNCGEERLRTIVDDALARNQIKPGEHSRLVGKIAERFGIPETAPKESEPEIDRPNGKRTPRSRKDHFNGTEGQVRPIVMRSKPIPNIRGTGPLNIRDFRNVTPTTTVVPVDRNLGSMFGARLSISTRNRR